jgi:hypothetical protein
MTMNTPTAPDPQEELDRLGPLILTLYEAFEAATQEGRQYFETRGRPINADLFPDLVRYHVKEFLDDRCQLLINFEREDTNRNGLRFAYRNRRYRMWKSDDDALPAPGKSQSKLEFLNQQPVLPGLEPYFQSVDGWNLVILWNVDSGYRLTALNLVCPKSADATAATLHWSVVIPHPVMNMHVKPIADDTTDDDLPIDLLGGDDARAENGHA